mgnify:CR=1 FL=1
MTIDFPFEPVNNLDPSGVTTKFLSNPVESGDPSAVFNPLEDIDPVRDQESDPVR